MKTKKSVRGATRVRTKTKAQSAARSTTWSRRSSPRAPRRLFGMRWHHIGGIGLLLIGLGWGLAANGAFPGTGHAASCTVSSTLVNSCRPWLGAFAGNYSEAASDFKSQILYHEQQIGRPLDVVHDYRPAGSNALTSYDSYFATRANTILMLNWKPANTWSDAAGGNASTNAGIDQMANSIKSVAPNKVMLAVFHEPENDVSAGGSPSCGSGFTYKGSAGSTADYVNMWHNVRARFDAAGVSNVVWVMNYMGFSNWNCMVKDLWPGNGYVDWVTWDPYLQSNSATWNGTIGTFYNYLSANSDANHDFNAKPWGLNEWGIDTGVDQAHAYADYDAARSALDNNTFPSLKLYDIFDTINPTDFRIDYSGSSTKDPTELSHYAAFANDAHFSNPSDPTPTPTPTPSDTTPPSVTITSPANNAPVSGILTISGDASDNVGVSSVTLRVDNVYLSTDTSSPYSFSLDTTKYSNGTHTIQLRAFDAANNMGQSSTITVTMNNASQGNSSGGTTGTSGGSTSSGSSGGTTTVISATTPSSSTPTPVKGTLIIAPSDNGQPVQVAVDGKLEASDAIDTTKLTNGTHVLTITEDGKTVHKSISVHNAWPRAIINTINAHRVSFIGSSLGAVVILAALTFWQLRLHLYRPKMAHNLVTFGSGKLIKPKKK